MSSFEQKKATYLGIPTQTSFERIEKPTIVREVVIPKEKIEVQPVIIREREQKEIHQIIQPMIEKETRPTIVEKRSLPAERRPEIRYEGPAPKPTRIISPSLETRPVQVERIVKEPIIQERVVKKIVEEIQPVIYKDVIQPTVVEEILPIEEKIVEAPTLVEEEVEMKEISEVEASTFINQQQPMPSPLPTQQPMPSPLPSQPISTPLPTQQPIPSPLPIQQPMPSPLPSQQPSPIFSEQRGYSANSSLPTILVLGATGKQGGSVATALLSSGRCNVRILTRALKEKAQELKSMGAEVFVGNLLNDMDIRNVMQGVYGVFAVTNYWDKEIGNREEEIGRRIALAARDAGVKHYIWSTLPNAQKISSGKYQVPHLTGKSRVNKYIKSLGFQYWTFVVTSFYFQNFMDIMAPRLEEGKLVWTIPMSDTGYITAFDVRDIGSIVLDILNDPINFNRKKIYLASEHLHPQDFIIQLGVQLKRPVKLELIPPEDYVKSGFGSEELAEMFSYFQDFSCFGKMDWSIGKRMYPSMRSWNQYLQLQSPSLESS